MYNLPHSYFISILSEIDMKQINNAILHMASERGRFYQMKEIVNSHYIV